MAKKYHVLTIQLRGLSKSRRTTIRKENPRGRRRTPFVTVRVTSSSQKVEAAKSGDFSSFFGWAKKGVALLEEESPAADSKLEAYEEQDRIVKRLRRRGWRVRHFNPKNRLVYVVRLKKSVWDEKKFREANEGELEDFAEFLYVGETGETAKQRYKIHTEKVNGKKHRNASNIVHNHPVGLAWDLMSEFKGSRYKLLGALRKEKEVAEQLREMGYATYFA